MIVSSITAQCNSSKMSEVSAGAHLTTWPRPPCPHTDNEKYTKCYENSRNATKIYENKRPKYRKRTKNIRNAVKSEKNEPRIKTPVRMQPTLAFEVVMFPNIC